MPMSKKVFKMKCKARFMLNLNLELMDRVESLLQSLKSGERGLKCNDSSVIYQYAQTKELLKGMQSARDELEKLL